jgi:hypothetical protein
VTVACPNHRCPEYQLAKPVLYAAPDLPIVCGACATLVVPVPEPEETP